MGHIERWLGNPDHHKKAEITDKPVNAPAEAERYRLQRFRNLRREGEDMLDPDEIASGYPEVPVSGMEVFGSHRMDTKAAIEPVTDWEALAFPKKAEPDQQ